MKRDPNEVRPTPISNLGIKIPRQEAHAREEGQFETRKRTRRAGDQLNPFDRKIRQQQYVLCTSVNHMFQIISKLVEGERFLSKSAASCDVFEWIFWAFVIQVKKVYTACLSVDFSRDILTRECLCMVARSKRVSGGQIFVAP